MYLSDPVHKWVKFSKYTANCNCCSAWDYIIYNNNNNNNNNNLIMKANFLIMFTGQQTCLNQGHVRHSKI